MTGRNNCCARDEREDLAHSSHVSFIPTSALRLRRWRAPIACRALLGPFVLFCVPFAFLDVVQYRDRYRPRSNTSLEAVFRLKPMKDCLVPSTGVTALTAYSNRRGIVPWWQVIQMFDCGPILSLGVTARCHHPLMAVDACSISLPHAFHFCFR